MLKVMRYVIFHNNHNWYLIVDLNKRVDISICFLTVDMCIYCKVKKRMRDAGRYAGRYPTAERPHAWAYLQFQCPF
jgi:hypothetical protein